MRKSPSLQHHAEMTVCLPGCNAASSACDDTLCWLCHQLEGGCFFYPPLNPPLSPTVNQPFTLRPLLDGDDGTFELGGGGGGRGGISNRLADILHGISQARSCFFRRLWQLRAFTVRGGSGAFSPRAAYFDVTQTAPQGRAGCHLWKAAFSFPPL